MTPQEIVAVLEAKVHVHPEFAEPLSWLSFRRILARENIGLFQVRLARSGAQLRYYDGEWSILINSNSPPRRHLWDAAHELGHLWLHARGGDGEFVRHYHSLSHEEAPDSREDEAEIFAALVLGPRRYFRVF